MRSNDKFTADEHDARRSKNRHLPIAILLLLSLAMTGCVSSPVVATSHNAVDAVMKNRLDKFRDELSPRAQRTLGTQQGMDALHQRLAGYTNVSVAEPLVTSSKQGDQGYDHYGDIRRGYEANVSGSASKDAPPELILTLLLQCKLAYGVYHHDETAESCSTTIDQNGVPWTNCTPGTPAYDSIDLGESCAVTGVR